MTMWETGVFCCLQFSIRKTGTLSCFFVLCSMNNCLQFGIPVLRRVKTYQMILTKLCKMAEIKVFRI